MGRPVLYFGEMQRMIHAENIIKAYHARAQSQNWAAWYDMNPFYAKILFEAERLVDVNV
jgi:hypothetical protein